MGAPPKGPHAKERGVLTWDFAESPQKTPRFPWWAPRPPHRTTPSGSAPNVPLPASQRRETQAILIVSGLKPPVTDAEFQG